MLTLEANLFLNLKPLYEILALMPPSGVIKKDTSSDLTQEIMQQINWIVIGTVKFFYNIKNNNDLKDATLI